MRSGRSKQNARDAIARQNLPTAMTGNIHLCIPLFLSGYAPERIIQIRGPGSIVQCWPIFVGNLETCVDHYWVRSHAD